MSSAAEQAMPATVARTTTTRASSVAFVRWRSVWPIAAPCALLLVGAGVGYPFSLDQPVAAERLVGLIVASILAIAAVAGLHRVKRPNGLLVGTSLAALAGGLWVISASGPDVFRGTVGAWLDRLFGPVFGLAQITDPVEVTNTRFIVGYNGLADLCLVAIFGCGALVIARPRRLQAVGLLAIIGVSLVLLIGTGARGGLTGLATGICAAGLFAWPRRYALVGLIAAPLAVAVAAIGILDKGLEFSSTAGRLTYWGDLARLLVEYPLTGVGLGVDTANMVALQYEINPDPDRLFYAHNTFVQTYLEQGPLGFVGMLMVVGVTIAAALIARRRGIQESKRPLMIAGLALVGGLEAHGLTDQVVTTNVGTAMLLVGLAAVVASLSADGSAALARWTGRALVIVGGLLALVLVGMAVIPGGRAQVLLNVGGLKMNRALLATDLDAASRAAALADSEATFSAALAQDGGHPGVLRDLGIVRTARFDDAGAASALQAAATSPRLDAFDILQIAHAYRDAGYVDQAYLWAARAYALWGRAPEDAVMQVYAQSTLTDSRARTLANQAEAAMRARTFSIAHSLFEQALAFEPDSAYLQDRIGASQRAIVKYGT